jgi:hypothetical protein
VNLVVGSGYLISGLGQLIVGIIADNVLQAAIGGGLLLCGFPWIITAVYLLRKRRSAASGPQPGTDSPVPRTYD